MNDMPIIIRRASLSDSAQLSEIYSYYVNNTAITFEDEAPAAEEFKGRMASVMSFYPYFVAEMNGVIIGYCYAGKFKDRSAYDWSVETTVYVKKGFGGKGAGRALYAALGEALKSQGIVNMYACIAVPEKEDEYLDFGSVNFHKKLGFEFIGKFKNCGSKFGRWYDMVWLGKVIADHVKNPAHPVPYNSVYKK